MLRRQTFKPLRHVKSAPQQPLSLDITPASQINIQRLLHCPATQGKPFCLFRRTQTREIKGNSSKKRLKIILFLSFTKNCGDKHLPVRVAMGYSHISVSATTRSWSQERTQGKFPGRWTGMEIQTANPLSLSLSLHFMLIFFNFLGSFHFRLLLPSK